jgi:molecular chaperone DnaJ
MNFDIDYYELLEVERTADEKTLKSAYRRIAMECHPDRNPGCDQSEARFKAVSQAYDVLKDPQKRAAYDRLGKAAFENGGMGGGGQGSAGFGDFSDIFESFFGDAFGGRQRGPARGADLRYDLEISLDEAFHGKDAEITIDVATACGTCEGTGATPGSGKRRCNLCAGHGKVLRCRTDMPDLSWPG